MRYPGHIALMRVLRESGFFDKVPIEVRGQRVVPLDLTVMRVEVDGVASDGLRRRFVWDLLDRYDPATRTTSMARTTGYTATAAVRLLARRAWTRPGIVPPEHLAADEGCFTAILADLEARGVHLARREEALA